MGTGSERSSAETFDGVWQRTGLGGLDLPVAQTIPATADRSTDPGSTAVELPPLGLPAAGEGSATPGLVLLEVLGEGGMGVVYRARQPQLDREVAVKRLRPEAPGHAAAALVREARTMGSLEHPNIIPVHDLGTDAGGAPVLVMKRIDGVAWAAMIRDPAHPAWSRRLGTDADPLVRNVEVLVDVCHAVAYAHARGILHRDLKPANVMIGAHGEVYVIDWGIAGTLDQPTRRVMGTPAFMAPEMVDPASLLTARTDVFLLGGCLHVVLAGRPPHAGTRLREVMAHAWEPEPVDLPLDVPRPLRAVCEQALAPHPDDRFPNVRALQQALLDWLRRRGATSVTEAAHHRLHEGERSLEDGETTRASAALAAARFGFAEALRVAPDHALARAGLRRVLEVLLEHELGRDNLVAASALLQDLQATGAGVDQHQAALEAARHRVEAALARARDHDLSVGRGARAATFAGLGVGTVGLGSTLLWLIDRGSLVLDPFVMMIIMVDFTLAVLIAIAVGRRALLATRLNRGMWTVVAGTCLIAVAHRVVAWAVDLPVHQILATDLLIVAGATLGLGAMLGAWILVTVPLGVLAAAICLVRPESAPLAFTVAGSLFFVGAGFWLRNPGGR